MDELCASVKTSKEYLSAGLKNPAHHQSLRPRDRLDFPFQSEYITIYGK